ncbi:MAG: hypothetical protein OYH76_01780 [Defluviicoccus sp.]|nr:hypothetical protein [Defluviicoccus sp.]MDE0274595.1 hypothetical protein [Defluviicoccus sp.]
MFRGFEADRGRSGTVKYRCPAAAFDLDCKGRDACHRAGGVKPGAYGRIVRVDLDKHDRRIFTPTPWGSPHWRRGYNRRSAMEPIDARLVRAALRRELAGLKKLVRCPPPTVSCLPRPCLKHSALQTHLGAHLAVLTC